MALWGSNGLANEAVPACLEETAALLDELRPAAPGEISISAAQTGRTIRGDLIFSSSGEPPLQRTVTGTACHEVIDALGFAIQVYLEERARTEPSLRQSGTGQSARGEPGTSAEDPRPEGLSGSSQGTSDGRPDSPNAVLDASPRQAGGKDPQAGAPRMRLGVGPVVDWSYAPDMALGLALTGRYSLGGTHWLGVSLAYGQTGFFSVRRSDLQTDAASLGLVWVETSKIGRSSFRVTFELGPRLTLLDTTIDDPVTPAHAVYAALGATVATTLSAEISPQVELDFGFGAAMQAAPNVPELASTRNFHPPSLGGLAHLGVSAFFR